jgi:hypothetical protein
VALTACLVWLLLALVPGASWSLPAEPVGSPPAQATEALPVTLTLESVTPSTIGPDQAFRISGTVRNTSAEPVEISAVEATSSYAALDTRGEIAAWASGEAGVATGLVLGEDPFDIALAPGARSDFVIEVAGDTVQPFFDFGTLPLTLEVLGGEGQVRGRVRSYLPWYAGEQPEQRLDLAWVVPLTVPPDPELSDPSADTRVAAWVDAIGPGSAPRTWLDGLADSPATFVVDPALLAPVVPQRPPEDEDPDEPDESPTQGPTTDAPTTDAPGATATTAPTTGRPTTAPPAPTGDDPDASPDESAATAPEPTDPEPTDPEPTDPAETTAAPGEPDLPGVEVPLDLSEVEQAQVDLETALAALAEDQLWWLPVADPDVAALIDIGTDPAEAAPMLTRTLPESALLSQQLLDSGRRDVAWPEWAGVGPGQVESLLEVWPQTQELSAAVVPHPALAVPGNSAAGRLTVEGAELTVLGLDTTLAGLLAQAPPPERDGETVQRMVAETLAFYQQSPARGRTLVLAPPRGTVIDPRTLDAVTDALAGAPWLEQTAAAAALAEPPPAQLTGTVLLDGAPGDPAAYPLPQPSPLSEPLLAEIEALRGTVAEIATILTDQAGVARWEPVLDGLVSTRWRLDRAAWRTPLNDVEDQVEAVLAGVQVNPTTVNFLADEGLIQVTVVNTLPTAVQDLRLNIEPGNARIRVIEPPEPFAIGAESRATVQFRARAVAAGEVPVTAYLSTPTGLAVGDEQVMQVRVQPTGVWIYWVLGGAAGVILVLGIGRALRRPAAAVADPDTMTQEDQP